MHLKIIKSSFSDNYFYLVWDDDLHAALIDPVDADAAIRAVEEEKLTLQWVVNTHFHHDHTAGNDAVLARFPDARLCAGPDHSMINCEHPVDNIVGDGDTLTVGHITFDVLETPGHTAGHISLRNGTDLFCGDTIFVGGAGNCRFGGDPSVLFHTYRDVLSALPDATAFYPGHDYARRNAEFALSLEPANHAAQEVLDRIQGDGIFLTTLGEERAYNPFFRANQTSLRVALQSNHGELWHSERESSDDDDEATFRTTRALRNNW